MPQQIFFSFFSQSFSSDFPILLFSLDEAFLGEGYFGLKSAPFKFYAYRWAADGIMATMDFTQDKCLPFAANMQGSQGTSKST